MADAGRTGALPGVAGAHLALVARFAPALRCELATAWRSWQGRIAARELGVRRETLRRWEQTGKTDPLERTPAGSDAAILASCGPWPHTTPHRRAKPCDRRRSSPAPAIRPPTGSTSAAPRTAASSTVRTYATSQSGLPLPARHGLARPTRRNLTPRPCRSLAAAARFAECARARPWLRARVLQEGPVPADQAYIFVRVEKGQWRYAVWLLASYAHIGALVRGDAPVPKSEDRARGAQGG